ncbi:hypothetical protein [Chelativorans sp. AA-79]|uniref:DUF6998 domain-containing protein n=1 Tax=Chelativorans sp. AA-79 TaxID=3028735 RepID=UPI0023F78FE1|nr:hypothetical protein [Chelativorans sp. AA-79]WEX07286.1 hypothetical protein PVE73_14210 [Chelativorans sp. AA-79]
MERDFVLPVVIARLVQARNALRQHFASTDLTFTFDGKLVGDIGEAIAAELFGVKPIGRGAGIDGRAPDGRTVQVKATGTRRGPAFNGLSPKANHLLFFELDFDALRGTVIFNGPENIARKVFPQSWIGSRAITRRQILAADGLVKNQDRLPRIA